MEIFGVAVYLNFLSVASFVPCLLCILGVASIIRMRKKSLNAWLFIFLTIGVGIFQFGFTFASATLLPVGAYHRWFTVISVIPQNALLFGFAMTYAEDFLVKKFRIAFIAMAVAGPIIAAVFCVQSLSAPRLFLASGQFWDFKLPITSGILAVMIITCAFTTLGFGLSKYRRMQNRRNAKTLLVILLGASLYTIPVSVINIMWRRGQVSADLYIWSQAIGTSVSFFIVFVIFLSHTDERSTVIGNLLGITLVSALVLIPFLAHPLIEDRKASFREIWAAKLQAGPAVLANGNVVLVSPISTSPPAPLDQMERGAKTHSTLIDQTALLPLSTLWRGGRGVRPEGSPFRSSYFRDNEEYYRKALAAIPSDGVLLRADAKGGVYTFPVELTATAYVTRLSGNSLVDGATAVTRNAGNSTPTLARQTYIAGIELVELRKYIHPTAAKLVLAQFVVILVIVSLFPLFFRGILLNPMRRLLDGVIAISRGRYGHRIENQRSDELGVISRHFDKMAVTIEASTTKLEETVAQRTAQLTEEKRKSDTLLLNILPARIADELKERAYAACAD